MNQTFLFDDLHLKITEKSPYIGGIWESETNLTLQEEKWFRQIYTDLKNFESPVVIDVGASTGCLSLFNTIRKFPIYSFEPNLTAFAELVQNVYQNGCNTSCYNIGLGEKYEESYLSVHEELWGYGYNKISKSETNEKIKIYPLDDIIPTNSKVTHVKIDVEGYELFVLRGMKRILYQKPIIYMEMIESNFEQFEYSSKEIVDFMVDLGYTYFPIDEHNYKFI